LNKGFWTGIKGLTARNVPGWLEFIDKEIKSSGDPVKILLARWIYVNNVILSYQDTNAYFSLRFEDVFAKDAVNPVNLLNQTREFLGCGNLDQGIQEEWLKVRPNKSRKDHSKKWPVQKEHLDFIMEKGEDLLRKFDYTIDDQFTNDDHEEVA
jgi:hypothetical protein